MRAVLVVLLALSAATAQARWNPIRYTDPDGRNSEARMEMRDMTQEEKERAAGVVIKGGLTLGALWGTGAALFRGAAAAYRIIRGTAVVGDAEAVVVAGEVLGGDGAAAANLSGQVTSAETKVVQREVQALRAGEKAAQAESKAYHRLGDSAETVAEVQQTGVLGGRPPRNIYQSDIPAVKAYDGPLPAGDKGFEFTTPIAPDVGSKPGQPVWRPGREGVAQTVAEDGTDWAWIPVDVTKVQP